MLTTLGSTLAKPQPYLDETGVLTGPAQLAIVFGVLHASIDKAPLHLCAVSGTLSLPQLKRYYERKDGFRIGLEMANMKLTFA